MKKLMKLLSIGVMLMMLALPALASDDDDDEGGPCHPEGYRTQTQGGWGQECNDDDRSGGGNVGCLRDDHWDDAFPDGLVIGGFYTITFTSSDAVAEFLTTGGTPDVLTQDYVDPADDTEAGIFAGQVTALAISLGFSEAGVDGFGPLGSLYYKHSVPWPGEPFSGMTVQELFDLANEVLSGNPAALPPGTTIPDLNEVITDINESFVGGNRDDDEDGNSTLVERECDQELPVEIAGFDAVAGENEIALSWNTASEQNIDYYLIERQSGAEWNSLARINSLGDSPTGNSYSFMDVSVMEGRLYSYRLTSREFDGTLLVHDRIVTASVTGSPVNATEYDLYQNYPNPFNPATTISFSLPEAGNIRLVVFDVLGRELAELANGHSDAGLHTVEFNAAALSAGTYFYQLTAGDFSAVRKLILVK